jgi:putative flippase GtrA
MATGKAIIATVKNDEYIRAHYKTTRAKVIAATLGLKTKYVQNRAWVLNVSKNKTRSN